MFELSVALKYLTPRWRQLSVSIISLISILVIALVVWLIVVFFSVTRGLEKTWTDKLIALTAPVRVTPTERYYNSYYYQIDGISANADYTHKSIGEKLKSELSDPYDPESDEELPSQWPAADRMANGDLVDPVKRAFYEIQKIPGVAAEDYEITFTNLRLRLLRPQEAIGARGYNQSFLTQASYLGTFDANHPSFETTLLPLSTKDLDNLINMVTVAPEDSSVEKPDFIQRVQASGYYKKLFELVEVKKLKTKAKGSPLPYSILPDESAYQVVYVPSDKESNGYVFLPQESAGVEAYIKQVAKGQKAELQKREGSLKIVLATGEILPVLANEPLIVEGGLLFDGSLDKETLSQAKKAKDVKVLATLPIQQTPLVGALSLVDVEIADAKVSATEDGYSPFWMEKGRHGYQLPSSFGEGILLPRSFKDGGILVGDRGYVSYYTPTVSDVQELRIPVVVAGFYDPGILPIGGKFILASRGLTNLIRASHNQDEGTMGNGINVRLDDISQAESVKKRIEEAFIKAGIAPYWQVQTYREYDFTRDIVQQLQSERNLFTLLATIIMIVACSNIISMLIILVNDKKIEIGILRAMGASSKSIAGIFGLCGLTLGLGGSIVGITLAAYTLKHLQTLIDLISRLQGFEMFNPTLYGDTLPAELNFETLGFVVAMTIIVSGIAGIVPAVKACLLRPSEILKAE